MITTSSLTPFCIFPHSSFGSFSSLPGLTTVPILDPLFPACLSDVVIFFCFFFLLDMSVLHATLCYDTVYCTGLWLKAGQGRAGHGRAGLFQVDVLCRARDLHKLFIVQLEGFPEKQRHALLQSFLDLT